MFTLNACNRLANFEFEFLKNDFETKNRKIAIDEFLNFWRVFNPL